MNDTAELELSLKRKEEGVYGLEMRFSQPGSDTDLRVGADRLTTASFDFNQMRALETDARQYGQGLTDALFADPDFQSGFAKIRASAQSLSEGIRLRLDNDTLAGILDNAALIRHAHIATVEGRRPPRPSDDCAAFLQAMIKAGYTGRISIEGQIDSPVEELPTALATMRSLIQGGN